MAIISVDKKQSQREKRKQKSFHFTWKKIKLVFLESFDSELKSLVANAVPESTRKSIKHAVNVFEGEESYKHTLEI